MIYVTRFSFQFQIDESKNMQKNLHVSVEGDIKKSILMPFNEKKIKWHVIIVYY